MVIFDADRYKDFVAVCDASSKKLKRLIPKGWYPSYTDADAVPLYCISPNSTTLDSQSYYFQDKDVLWSENVPAYEAGTLSPVEDKLHALASLFSYISYNNVKSYVAAGGNTVNITADTIHEITITCIADFIRISDSFSVFELYAGQSITYKSDRRIGFGIEIEAMYGPGQGICIVKY